jgi:hypothetical protein
MLSGGPQAHGQVFPGSIEILSSRDFQFSSLFLSVLPALIGSLERPLNAVYRSVERDFSPERKLLLEAKSTNQRKQPSNLEYRH